jgi:hypothetical protein
VISSFAVAVSDAHGWLWQEEHLFTDAATSGATIRPPTLIPSFGTVTTV